MAIRTTAAAVKLIVEVDGNISADLAPFMEAASALVDEVCATATKPDPDGNPVACYDDTRLELIERWLSAHFYRVRDPAPGQETAGPVAATYKFNVGLVLMGTKEGQQACMLDTNGGLARLSKQMETGRRRKVQAIWLGTPLCP